MKRFLIVVLTLCVTAPLCGLGSAEDPAEVVTRTFNLGALRTLEIRGEIQLEIRTAAVSTLTVSASRALFDQLSVSNWWGWATIAIESGLRGPRERGPVKIVLELPSLEELTINDKSSGTIQWPSSSGKLKVGEGSAVTVVLEASTFQAEVSWRSGLRMVGKVTDLQLSGRHQSHLDIRDLAAEEVRAEVDEASVLLAGSPRHGTVSLRRGGKIDLPQGSPSPWTVHEEGEGF